MIRFELYAHKWADLSATDLMEDKTDAVASTKGTFGFEIRPFELKTFKLV